jgi:hypothetical protein
MPQYRVDPRGVETSPGNWDIDCNAEINQMYYLRFAEPHPRSDAINDINTEYITMMTTSPYSVIYADLIKAAKGVTHAFITDIQDPTYTLNQSLAAYEFRLIVIIDDFQDAYDALWNARNP